MPRLFTGLEIPPDVADRLWGLRGGLGGARWIDRANYHVTLRFLGDVDGATARDVLAVLSECRPRDPLAVSLVALDVFGGDKPRALLAKVSADPALARLQAEQERLLRRAGLPPETRKFVPHVTLARLRRSSPGDVAAFMATRGGWPALRFTASRFVLYSARDSVGGGPYVVEAAFPLAGPGEAEPAGAGWELDSFAFGPSTIAPVTTTARDDPAS